MCPSPKQPVTCYITVGPEPLRSKAALPGGERRMVIYPNGRSQHFRHKRRPYRAEIGALSRTFTSMVAAQLSENSTGCAHLFSGHVLFFLLSRKQPGLVQCLPDLSVNEHNAPASMFGKEDGELSEQRKDTFVSWGRAFVFGVIHLWRVVTWTVASSPVQIAFSQNIRQALGWL